MNVHKFIAKPGTSTTSNLTIKWSLGQNLKYPPSKVSATTWKFLAKEISIFNLKKLNE